jgi:hypothetical protein
MVRVADVGGGDDGGGGDGMAEGLGSGRTGRGRARRRVCVSDGERFGIESDWDVIEDSEANEHTDACEDEDEDEAKESWDMLAPPMRESGGLGVMGWEGIGGLQHARDGYK